MKYVIVIIEMYISIHFSLSFIIVSKEVYSCILIVFQMANLSDLMGNPSEIDKFLQEEKPFWPNILMACPVEQCFSLVKHNRFSGFRRHWKQNHVPMKMSYQCSSCKNKFWRKDFATRHCKSKKCEGSTITEREEINDVYINPGETYRMNHRERLAEKRKCLGTPGESLVTPRADCRDEVVQFDQDGRTLTKQFKH